MNVNLTGLLTIIAVLSIVAERTVELLKGVIPYDKIGDDKLKTLAIQGTSIAVAITTAVTSTAAIDPQLPAYLQGTLGYILLGLVAGTGSVGTHQAFAIFESWKKIKQEELSQAKTSSELYKADLDERTSSK